MRLFTALWPPAEVLPDVVVPDGWRPVPAERWHVTLAFHGVDDPAVRAADLDGRLSGARAPRLRLAGCGTFPGVLWAGVVAAGPDDLAVLHALVAGAGGDPDTYLPHLTLARARRRRRPVVPYLPPGPWWTPAEALLVASESDATGLHYRPVHRVPLERDVSAAGA